MISIDQPPFIGYTDDNHIVFYHQQYDFYRPTIVNGYTENHIVTRKEILCIITSYIRILDSDCFIASVFYALLYAFGYFYSCRGIRLKNMPF